MAKALPIVLGLAATIVTGGAAIPGVAAAIGLTAGTMSAIGVGIGLVGTLAGTLLAQTPPKPKMQDGDVSIKQAIPPRSRLYGRQRLGGVFLFYDSTPDGDLKTLVCHAAHECDGWEEDWLNDERVTLDGDGNVTDDPWWQGSDDDSVVVIQHYAGSPTQVIPSFDDKWTADHQGHGLCCSYVKYSDLKDKKQIKVFPSGPPPYRAVLRGAKIFDPRIAGTDPGEHNPANEATWTWSDNAALVVLDYMTRTERGVPVGFGIPFDRVDLDSFAAAADICDQLIPKKGGGVEPRWRAWGAYELTEDRKAVLGDLLDACAGRLIQGPDGKLGLAVGAGPYRAMAGDAFTIPSGVPAASVSLNDDQILEYDFSTGKPAIERINEVRATYVSQAWEWAETEAGIQMDQAGQERNGVESSQIKLRFVPSESQAQRVAREVLRRGNPTWSGRIRTTLAGLNCWGERWITLTISELAGLTNVLFEVTSMRVDRTTMTAELEVASYDDWWTWTAETDEADPATPPPNTDEDNDLPVPEGVAVSIIHRLVNGQTYVAVGLITWDPPPRSVYIGEAHYRTAAVGMTPAGPWQPLPVAQDDDQVETFPLADGVGYEAEVRFIGPAGAGSDWSAVATFTAVADPVAPASPVGLTAQANTPATGQVTVSATQPNDPRAATLRLYRNSSNTFTGATLLSGMPLYAGPGQSRSVVESPGAGDWWYFATSSNWSGVASAPAGGVLAEVSPAAPVITTSPATIGQTNPTITGTSVPSASIKVFANAVLNTTTTADGSGNWSVALIGLGSGAQAITATATIAGNESAASGSVTLTVVWYDPDASGHCNFKSNLARLNGSTSSFASIFGTITTSAQIVTYADGSLHAVAANNLPLSDLGLEVWEARTNRLTHRNANPTDLTGVTLSGDGAATLTRVDDSANMGAGSILNPLLSSGTTNGFVYKLDNSAGSTDAFCTFSGTVGATGACRGSTVHRGSAGRIEIGGATAVSFGASTPYARVGGSRTAAATSEQMRIAAPAGAVIYFTLDQLENGAFDTAPIVANAATATRNAPTINRTLSTDFNSAEGFIGIRAKVVSGVTTNGVVFAIRESDTSNWIYNQFIGTATLRANTQVAAASTGGPLDKTVTGTTMQQAVYGYKANDFAFAVAGGAASTDVSGAVPTGTPATLRLCDSIPLNGIIEQIKWATTKPSNATIQAKSGWTIL